MRTNSQLDKDNLSRINSNLSDVSTRLNRASDALGEMIISVNEYLQKLSLGVSAWLPIASGDQWSRFLGYTRYEKVWTLAIKQTSGIRDIPGFEETVWPFNDSPRWMRIEAVGYIEAFLEHLIARAEETEKQLIKKSDELSVVLTILGTKDEKSV